MAIEFTLRENDVLHLLGKGMSNKEMAQRLSISENTVKFHLQRIYRKMSVTSRTQLCLKAFDHEVLRQQLNFEAIAEDGNSQKIIINNLK